MHPIPTIVKLRESDGERQLQEYITEAVKALKLGHIIALPTDTIYGIAALAQNTRAVQQLYEIKGRHTEKPIAICVGDITDVKKWGKVTVGENVLEDLLPGPVTLVFERTKELNPELNPGTRLVGVRIPNLEFVQKLAVACCEPLALTSANVSAAQSTLTIEEFKSLWPKLNLIVDGGLLGQTEKCRQGSTVINMSIPGQFSIIREGSAYQQTLSVLEGKHKLQNSD